MIYDNYFMKGLAGEKAYNDVIASGANLKQKLISLKEFLKQNLIANYAQSTTEL